MSLLKRIETQQKLVYEAKLSGIRRTAKTAEISVRTCPIGKYPLRGDSERAIMVQTITTDALKIFANGERIPAILRKDIGNGNLLTVVYSEDNEKRLQIVENNDTDDVAVSLFRVEHSPNVANLKPELRGLDLQVARYELGGKNLLIRHSVEINTQAKFKDELAKVEEARIAVDAPELALRQDFKFIEKPTWVAGKSIIDRNQEVAVLAIGATKESGSFIAAYGTQLAEYLEKEFPIDEEENDDAIELVGFHNRDGKQKKILLHVEPSTPRVNRQIEIERAEFATQAILKLHHLHTLKVFADKMDASLKNAPENVELQMLSNALIEFSQAGPTSNRVEVLKLAAEIREGHNAVGKLLGIETVLRTPGYTFELRTSDSEKYRLIVLAQPRTLEVKGFKRVITTDDTSRYVYFEENVPAVIKS